MFKVPRDLRKQASVVEIDDPDGKMLEVGLVMCCHCGGHFEKRPGSGKVRGWCGNCCGHVCGPGCAECVNFEKQLDMIDGGVSPTAVSVGGGKPTTARIWTPGA